MSVLAVEKALTFLEPGAEAAGEAGLSLPRKVVSPAVILRVLVVGRVPLPAHPVEPALQLEPVCQGCLALRGHLLVRWNVETAPRPAPLPQAACRRAAMCSGSVRSCSLGTSGF